MCMLVVHKECVHVVLTAVRLRALYMYAHTMHTSSAASALPRGTMFQGCRESSRNSRIRCACVSATCTNA